MDNTPAALAIALAQLNTLEEALSRIELAVWVLIILVGVFFYTYLKRSQKPDGLDVDLDKEFKGLYERGNYKEALNMLEVLALDKPADASIPFWQGCCYFRMKEWESAVKKFEAAVLMEPPYRQSVKDYMEFIELNELVPGVSGYVKQSPDSQ